MTRFSAAGPTGQPPEQLTFSEVAQAEAPRPAEEDYRGAHFSPEPRRDWLTLAPKRPPRPSLRGWPAVAAISFVATVLSWRSEAWRPVVAGLSSWQTGVTEAFMHHFQWGRDVVFTFGPYGFVEDILPISHLTAALSLAYALAMAWGLAALVASALRSSWGLVPAGLAAWAVLAIVGNFVEAPELGLCVALGLALACVRGSSQLRTGLLAAVAGFQLLVEINVGLVTVGLVVIAIFGAGRRWWRAALVAAPALAGTLLIAWVAAGQEIGDLPSYFAGSWSVLSGYAAAMSQSGSRQAEDYFALVDLGLLATVFGLHLKSRPRLEKAAVSIALLGWAWEAVKEGFIRHDLHDLVFFSAILAALALARLPRRLLPVQACAIAVAATLTCIARGSPPPQMASPLVDARALVEEVRDLNVAPHWARVRKRAHLTVLYTGERLPGALVRALQGHSVAAVPVEDAIAFAYPSLKWDPLPVLQSYSAYTGYLDQLDANFLSSGRAPERILYKPFSIDGREPAWGPPATMLTMYCRYSPVPALSPSLRADGELVLARTANRCGAARPLAHVVARFGQWVKVPAAPARDEIVAARFELGQTLGTRVEGALLKPPAVYAELGAPGRSTSWRFLTGTADDLHAMAVPASLGFPAAILPPPVTEVRLLGGGWRDGGGNISITFYALSLRASGLR